MAEIEIELDDCVYCGEKRHIRNMKIIADTFDEVSGSTAIREVGKYRICEECLEFLGRMLECNVNLRNHVASVKPLAEPEPIKPIPIGDIVIEHADLAKEPESVPSDDTAMFRGYKRFAVIKNVEELINYAGWDILKIIKKAEQYTEYGFPHKVVQRTIQQNPTYVSAACGSINNAWVETPQNIETEKVFPIIRKVTHYLIGLRENEALAELNYELTTKKQEIVQITEQFNRIIEQHEAAKRKIEALTKASKELLDQNTQYSEKISTLETQNQNLRDISKAAEQEVVSLQQRLVDNGMVRNIELGDTESEPQ